MTESVNNDTFLSLVVGTTGTGKSTFLANTAKRYVKDYPDYEVVILDPQGTFPRINHKRIKYPHLKIKKIGRNKTFDLTFLDEIYNSLIIIDDTKIIFEDWQGLELKQLSINKRHKNNDIILVYHGLSDVVKNLYHTTDMMYLFKINDNWQKVKSNLPPQITEEDFILATQLKRFQRITINFHENDIE